LIEPTGKHNETAAHRLNTLREPIGLLPPALSAAGRPRFE
jgi:hypothetical protein